MGFIPQTQVSNRWLTITKSYLSLILLKKLSRFGDGKTILTRIISEVCVPGLLSYHVQTPQATMTSQAVSSWIGIRLLPLGRSIDDCSPAHEQVERGGSFRVVDNQFWNYEVILNDRLTLRCDITVFSLNWAFDFVIQSIMKEVRNACRLDFDKSKSSATKLHQGIPGKGGVINAEFWV